MKKNFFKTRKIHCARCGYRGQARRNKIHGALLFLLVGFLFFQLLADSSLFGRLSLITTLLFVVPVLWGVSRLIIHDERALACPGCGNVHYDIVRE